MKKKYDENINEECIVTRLYEDVIPCELNHVLVAVINDKIIGYLFGYILNNGDAYLEKSSKLEALYVLEEYRNMGVASSLIKEFKTWSKSMNAKYMEVQVLNNNKNAIKLYSKEKFVPLKSILINNIE